MNQEDSSMNSSDQRWSRISFDVGPALSPVPNIGGEMTANERWGIRALLYLIDYRGRVYFQNTALNKRASLTSNWNSS